jgi:hypothetical protein
MRVNHESRELTRITREILEVRRFRMGINRFFRPNEQGKLV